MKLGIMQPYFFPYIGYFQLMNHVDEYVVYNNIQFTKKGWIHRNRILVNGQDQYISLPIQKDSDYLDVEKRVIADAWDKEKNKMINRIKESYRKAPEFARIFPVIEEILLSEERNLFQFILNSLVRINEHLEIKTQLIKSTDVDIDHNLKGADKVLAITKARSADTYINPIGGVDLYDKAIFKNEGINLQFIQADLNPYSQFSNEFVNGLSIIDVLMFNSENEVKEVLNQFTIV